MSKVDITISEYNMMVVWSLQLVYSVIGDTALCRELTLVLETAGDTALGSLSLS